MNPVWTNLYDLALVTRLENWDQFEIIITKPKMMKCPETVNLFIINLTVINAFKKAWMTE